MRKTLLGKFVGVLLAFLAVGSMTLLQVDPTYAAAQVQTTRVKVILSRAQLALLAQQNHALYAKVIKAYQAGSPLVVTQHEYRVLVRLSTAYLGAAKAGQPAPGAPGTAKSDNGGQDTHISSAHIRPAGAVHPGHGATSCRPYCWLGAVSAFGRGFHGCAGIELV